MKRWSVSATTAPLALLSIVFEQVRATRKNVLARQRRARQGDDQLRRPWQTRCR